MQPVLEIALVRAIGQSDWLLDWVRVRGGGTINTVKCSEPKPITKAFVEDFRTLIEEYLPPQDSQPSVLTADGPFELHNLRLAKLRVLFPHPRDGFERLLVRFQRGVGNLMSVLVPGMRHSSSLRDELENQAVRTLVELVQPCLDLAWLDLPSSLDEIDHKVIGTRMMMLRSRRAELAMFATLLQRFVAHDPGDRYARPLVTRESDRQIIDEMTDAAAKRPEDRAKVLVRPDAGRALAG